MKQRRIRRLVDGDESDLFVRLQRYLPGCEPRARTSWAFMGARAHTHTHLHQGSKVCSCVAHRAVGQMLGDAWQPLRKGQQKLEPRRACRQRTSYKKLASSSLNGLYSNSAEEGRAQNSPFHLVSDCFTPSVPTQSSAQSSVLSPSWRIYRNT
jgi:hypothetical protein